MILLRSELTYRDICFAICSLGCVYQLVKVSIVFFYFDTLLLLKVERPKNYSLPGLTICMDKTLLLHRAKADPYLTQTDKYILKAFNHLAFETMTQAEQLFHRMAFLPINIQHNITNDVKDMKFTCFLESIGMKNCIKFFKIIPYLTLSEKCFDFRPRGNYSFDRPIIPRRGQLRIIFNKPSQRQNAHLKIAIHSPYHAVKFWSQNWFSVNYDFHDSIDLTYTVSKKTFLPYPFSTRCSEYNNEECIAHCLYHVFPSQSNKWLPTVPGFENNHHLFEYHDAIEMDHINSIKIIRDCEKTCDGSMQCHKEDYKTLLVSQNVEKFKSFFQISVTPPEMIISENLVPKLSLVEFICYLGSTFGLWLGGSLFSLMYNVHIALKKTVISRIKNV